MTVIQNTDTKKKKICFEETLAPVLVRFYIDVVHYHLNAKTVLSATKFPMYKNIIIRIIHRSRKRRIVRLFCTFIIRLHDIFFYLTYYHDIPM